ncbi:hypothetical protein ACFT0G_22615 [Streptomyces sp. NPDC057020]|uniref:hypothetical protein n=1 Tax=unclassified Streptomyces TaxID=2593676 RepID=UPI00363B696F
MENDKDITLLRDAMDRTADGLPPLPDLAPIAVREGRRRRARSRLAAGAAAFAVVTAGVLGVTVLPRPGADATGVSTGVGGEAERRADYQRRMAALLDELLPAKVTSVRPVKDETGQYRITVGGRTFPMVASVRPAAEGRGACTWNPKSAACAGKELQSGGISGLCGAYVQYSLGRSEITLRVRSGTSSGPLAVEDLLAVGQEPRFVNLVKEADARPVQPREKSLLETLPLTLTPEEQRQLANCEPIQRAR